MSEAQRKAVREIKESVERARRDMAVAGPKITARLRAVIDSVKA